MMTGTIVQEQGRWVVQVGNLRIDVDADFRRLADEAANQGAQDYAAAHPTPADVSAQLERYAQIVAICRPDAQVHAIG